MPTENEIKHVHSRKPKGPFHYQDPASLASIHLLHQEEIGKNGSSGLTMEAEEVVWLSHLDHRQDTPYLPGQPFLEGQSSRKHNSLPLGLSEMHIAEHNFVDRLPETSILLCHKPAFPK